MAISSMFIIGVYVTVVFVALYLIAQINKEDENE